MSQEYAFNKDLEEAEVQIAHQGGTEPSEPAADGEELTKDENMTKGGKKKPKKMDLTGMSAK